MTRWRSVAIDKISFVRNGSIFSAREAEEDIKQELGFSVEIVVQGFDYVLRYKDDVYDSFPSVIMAKSALYRGFCKYIIRKTTEFSNLTEC